jgi:tetratricopeptide (TPR) repeat protein
MAASVSLDDALDIYERGMDARSEGDDELAFELVHSALAAIQRLAGDDAAIARARIAITRAEIASRAKPADAIELAGDAVERARLVARLEPRLEASALYMLGKAERSSPEHDHGAASFARSLALWRKLEGDRCVYVTEAAGSLGVAYVKIAKWQHAVNAFDMAIASDETGPQPSHLLNRAIAHERLDEHDRAAADLDSWNADGTVDLSPGDLIAAKLCVARSAAKRGDAVRAAEHLEQAAALVRQLPAEHPLQASLLEAVAWFLATAKSPPWLLASEVLMRRAAAIVWSPALGDSASRIAGMWRPGVDEELVQPTFAAVEIEAQLMTWNSDAITYAPRQGRQLLHIIVAGAPTTIERLGDARWRELCLQRLFSTFHAEKFDARDRSFVAPVRSIARKLAPEHVLTLLPSLRVPVWATAKTCTINSMGEVEVTGDAAFAALVLRATQIADDAAVDAFVRAVPEVDRATARTLLDQPATSLINPAAAIPLVPSA